MFKRLHENEMLQYSVQLAPYSVTMQKFVNSTTTRSKQKLSAWITLNLISGTAWKFGADWVQEVFLSYLLGSKPLCCGWRSNQWACSNLGFKLSLVPRNCRESESRSFSFLSWHNDCELNKSEKNISNNSASSEIWRIACGNSKCLK